MINKYLLQEDQRAREIGIRGDDFSVTNVVLPTMPYVIVRESYINNSCLVDGLPLNEVRLITEKEGDAQINTDRDRLINAVNFYVSSPLVSFLYHNITIWITISRFIPELCSRLRDIEK